MLYHTFIHSLNNLFFFCFFNFIFCQQKQVDKRTREEVKIFVKNKRNNNNKLDINKKNMDETQIIEPTAPVSVSLTSTTTTTETTTTTNNDIVKKSSIPDRHLSHYCLRLVDRSTTVVGLFAGPNRIGRSPDSQLCILDKSVSKSHACLHLTLNEDSNDLVKCEARDEGATNHTRVIQSDNEKTVTLDGDRPVEIRLGDRIVFGSVKFQFSMVNKTNNQQKITLIDLS